MDEHDDWLAQRFEENRTHLRSVAYRMLGSLSEAEDAVQESWLRLSRTDATSIENLRAWLTTVVARVCLNMLQSRRSLREEPLDVPVLDPDVVLRVDAGVLQRAGPGGTSTLIRGAEEVASGAIRFGRLVPHARPALVNGAAGGRAGLDRE